MTGLVLLLILVAGAALVAWGGLLWTVGKDGEGES